MKKTLLNSFISLYLAACGSLHAADPDLVKGVDFTGASSFTPSQLNQLVDNAYVGPYRGMVIYTNGYPSASVITKYQRYLWLDTSTALPTPKVWNTNGYWTNIVATAVIADYSVTTDKIATNAVTTIKIADNAVTDAKIQDATITGTKIGTGTITSTNIAVGTITSANIGNLQVGSANIAAAAITGDKIAANSIGTYMLTNGFALAGSNVASGTITSTNIATGGIILSNLTVAGASTYSSVVYNGSSVAYDYPVVKYETNAAMPTVANVTYTNLAGAGTFTHSLGGVPHIVRVVMVNKANTGSGGYSVGDEIGIESLSAVGQRYFKPLFVTYADATKVDLFWYREDTYSYIGKSHTSTITCAGDTLAADWNFKIIAIRFKY